jgi:hypothetical protein
MQYVAMSRKVQVSVDNHLQLIGEEDFHTCKAVTWDKPTKEDLESTATQWIQYCIDLTGGAPPGNTREVEIWRAKAADVRRGKPNIQFADGISEEKAVDEIKRVIAEHTVVLFIKGTRQVARTSFCAPQTNACLNAQRTPVGEGVSTFLNPTPYTLHPTYCILHATLSPTPNALRCLCRRPNAASRTRRCTCLINCRSALNPEP